MDKPPEKLSCRSPADIGLGKRRENAKGPLAKQVAADAQLNAFLNDTAMMKSPRVLSDYNPNRKKKKHNMLLDQIGSTLMRPLHTILPNAMRDEEKNKVTAEDLEDQELKMRRLKSIETANIPVFRSPSPPSSSDGSEPPTRYERPKDAKDDGFCHELYLRQLVSALNNSKEAPSKKASKSDVPSIQGLPVRAKQMFNEELVGKNEEEFHRKKFPQVVKMHFLYEDMQKMAQNSPTVGEFRQNYHTCCGDWFYGGNCGACHLLKILIVGIILCCFVVLLFDPCFLGPPQPLPLPLHENTTARENATQSTLNQTQPTDPTRKKTTPISSRPSEAPTGHPKLINLLHRSVTDDPWAVHHNYREPKTKSNRTGNSTDEQHSSTKVVMAPAEYCIFKAFYLACIGLNVMAYIAIYVVFTSQIVLRHYNIDWFLYESCLVLLASLLLFAFSIAAYFYFTKFVAITFLLIASVVGLLIGWWSYRYHMGGINPLMIIASSNPDMDEITQILGRKQISKFFKFGKDGED